jgi:hypothetical protein
MKNKAFILIIILSTLFHSCISIKKYKIESSKLKNQATALSEAKGETKNLLETVQALNQKNHNYNSDLLLFENNNEQLNKENAELKETIEELNLSATSIRSDLENLNSVIDLLKDKSSTDKKTIIYKTDTLNKVSHEIITGKVAFYSPKEMYYNQVYDAYGLIADVLSDKNIKDLVIKNIKQHARSADDFDLEDPEILIKAVQFYKTIELKLENTVKDRFSIVDVHGNDKQDFSKKMEQWHWKITPLSTLAKQQLLLNVIVYDENGMPSPLIKKTYHFDIKIKPYNFIQNTKVLFVENPKWAFGSIIIPFLTFLIGRITKKKKPIS